MLRLGLLGHPIGESLSPVMHRAALAAAGLEGDYALFDVPAESGLDAVWQRLVRGELEGLNVTVPYKRHAALVATLSPTAAHLGAVNTLARAPDGTIIGHNTDLPGLIASIVEAWGEASIEGPALVVGAGGAAAPALVAARELGADDVRIWNRTPARAAELVSRLGLGRVVSDPESGAAGACLVIQASSHGMGARDLALAAAEDEARAILAHTAPGARVVDLVYRPRPTAWVRAAALLGRPAIDGLAMLIHQAALAFELWSGARRDVDARARAAPALVELMRAAATEELARRAQVRP